MINLDMRLLRSFVEVARLKSFSRAAERLACSQATMSLRIKDLEQVLEQKLFTRNYHLIELTKAGRDLLPQAQIILDHHDALFDKARTGKIAGSVRLGIAEDYGETFLSRLMRVVDTSFPYVELNVTCAMSIKLHRLIELGKLDIAILTLPEIDDESMILSQPKLVWVASKDYIVDPDKPWPVAFYAQGCVFRAAAEAALDNAGQRYREVLSTSSGEIIKSAVSSGTAITVMAEGTVPADFCILPKAAGLPELPDSFIHMVERYGELSKAAQQIKISIKKLLGVSE